MILKTVIDADNSALFVIWTVLDYPKGFDLELDDLPDAIRSLDEVIQSRSRSLHISQSFF